MMGRVYLIACIFLCTITLGVQAANTDLIGLQSFYNSLDSNSQTDVLFDWDFSTPNPNYCNWTGVTCLGGLVQKLIFTNYGLVGTIPANLTKLTRLSQFDINTNSFSGTVPPEIYNMTSMQILRLTSNQLTGTLPYSLMGMPNLEKIYFDLNTFSGSLPEDVAGLNRTFNYFTAANNQLTGTIPSGYGALSLMTYFLINTNHLNGTIPASLGNLIYVTQFKLGSNMLTGTIPSSLGNLKSVLLFHLYSNQLSGTIPATLGNLPKVTQLYLYQNQLSGTIPSSLGNLVSLQALELYKNKLIGTMPINLGNIYSLQTLNLYQNSIQGSIPLSFTTLGNLTTLVLYNNQLKSPIPDLTSLPLSVISIGGNQFSGAFPSFWQTKPAGVTFSLSANCWDETTMPSWALSTYSASSTCAKATCGDELCSSVENCTTCAADCFSPCTPVVKSQSCNDSYNGGCDNLTQCVDTTYSFYCTACPSGYTGTGLSGCVDIDECNTTDPTYKDDCDPYMQCVNLPGTFTCDDCGFGSYQVGHTCVDINECNTDNGGCSADRQCINLIKNGSYCGNCSVGRIVIGNVSCSAVDPCSVSQLNECSPNAYCLHPSDDPALISNYTCQCKEGYEGDGETCDAVDAAVRYHSFDKGLSGGLGAVVGVGVLITTFGAVMLAMFWANFARHGSFYCAVIVAGVYLSYVAALVVLPHHTDALCILFPWFLGIAFVLVYGCLFIKTWALYKVWRNATNFKKTNLTPFYIIKLIGCELAVEIAFLIIWTAVDPPNVHYRKMVDNTYSPECKSKSPAWWAVFLGVKGAWLLFGAVLSILTRDIAKEYNESASIAYATYNNVVLGVVAVPLALVLEKVPGGDEIIEVAVVVLAFTFTMCILFFEIWYRIFFPDKNIVETKLGAPRSTGSGGSATTAAKTTTVSSMSSKSSKSSADSASAGNV